MQPFTCPQCGHRSTFDPWVGAAHCPRCGFSPPAGGGSNDYSRVDYDQSAAEYAAHRKVHPGVFQELSAHCQAGSGFRALEVGCGTGNYVAALAGRFGCSTYGLDPSAGMLAQARNQAERVAWLQGRAEVLPFAGDSLDLIVTVDVIHHVVDRAAFYREVARTLRAGGRVCTVTDSEDIIRRREILSGYFPETVEIELARYPRLVQLRTWMADAGLTEQQTVTVEQAYEIRSAQPFRDRAYSSLHLIPEAAWQAGLARLEQDLARGPVRGVSRYACLWARAGAQSGKPWSRIENLTDGNLTGGNLTDGIEQGIMNKSRIE